MKKQIEKRRRWIVRMRCTVTKDVIVEDCTEQQARTEPFEHAICEDEVDQQDWDVLAVTPD